MLNESEKLTINLSVVDLAQIDVLVEQGVYANRSDFIRTSVRKHIEGYSERINQQFIPISKNREWYKVIGIYKISKNTLVNLAKENEKLRINVIGMMVVDNDVSLELFKSVVDNVILKGKLIAPNEIQTYVCSLN